LGLRCIASLCLLGFSVAAIAVPSAAVILATPDGTLNTAAPKGPAAGEPEDPGWANVGRRGEVTAIYLGNGWVLTVTHVGVASVVFDGVEIEAVPSSAVVLENSPGADADLRLFRIVSDPGLPSLDVSVASPPLNAEVVMIGHGRDRGTAISWEGHDGWEWGDDSTKRWGTNRVNLAGSDVTMASMTTRSFSTLFGVDSPLDTDFEAHAAVGDSGGAVFYAGPSGWQLAGVMHTISSFGGQPASTALDGNASFSADLAHFASLIGIVTAVPACSDGSDDDGDGRIDHPDDPGCDSATDPFETNTKLPCDNGFDDDDDGLRDSADPGCRDPRWSREDPECDDGSDNDGDGAIDAAGGPGGEPADPECDGRRWARREKPRGCGLGFEVVVIALLLIRLCKR
jgi:hypothetical protein